MASANNKALPSLELMLVYLTVVLPDTTVKVRVVR